MNTCNCEHTEGWTCTQPAGHDGPHIATTPNHQVCSTWRDEPDLFSADQTTLLRVVHRSDLRSYACGAMAATCLLLALWCALRIAGTI